MPDITLRIEQSNNTFRLDGIEADYTRSFKEQARGEVRVYREDWNNIVGSIDERNDKFFIEVDGTDEFGGRFDDSETNGATVSVRLNSPEIDAAEAEPTDDNLTYIIRSADFIAQEAISAVPTLTTGTINTTPTGIRYSVSHGSQSKILYDLREMTGVEFRYNADFSVDVLDRLGKLRALTLGPGEGNVGTGFNKTVDQRENVTHVRVLGGQQGPNQVTAEAVSSVYTGGRKVWRRYPKKEIIDPARAQDVADALIDEYENDPRAVEVECRIYNEALSLGDTVTVDYPEENINRDLRIVSLTREITRRGFVILATLSNRALTTENTGSTKRNDDIQTHNRGHGGFVDRDQVTSGWNPAGDGTPQTLEVVNWPDDIVEEKTVELVVQGRAWRSPVDPLSHDHSVSIPDHTHDVDVTHPSHTHDVTHPSHDHDVTHPSHDHVIDESDLDHTHDVDVSHPSHDHVIDESDLDHTHDVDVTHPSHTHDVTHPSHTHDVTHPSHDHDVTHPSHDHDVTISDTSTDNSDLNNIEDSGTSLSTEPLDAGNGWTTIRSFTLSGQQPISALYAHISLQDLNNAYGSIQVRLYDKTDAEYYPLLSNSAALSGVLQNIVDYQFVTAIVPKDASGHSFEWQADASNGDSDITYTSWFQTIGKHTHDVSDTSTSDTALGTNETSTTALGTTETSTTALGTNETSTTALGTTNTETSAATTDAVTATSDAALGTTSTETSKATTDAVTATSDAALGTNETSTTALGTNETSTTALGTTSTETTKNGGATTQTTTTTTGLDPTVITSFNGNTYYPTDVEIKVNGTTITTISGNNTQKWQETVDLTGELSAGSNTITATPTGQRGSINLTLASELFRRGEVS